VDLHENNPWFTFEAATSEPAGAMEIRYGLTIKADRVEASDLSAYLDAVDEVRAVAGYRLTRSLPSGRAWPLEERKAFLGFLAGLGLGALIPAGMLGLGALFVAARRGRRGEAAPE
jgi:hypothetical protein